MLALLLVLVCPALTTGQVADGATAIPDHVTLTWTGNPSTTMTITWRTDTSVSTGFVEYQDGTALTNTPLRIRACSSNFTTDLQATRLFNATLTSLTPGTKYTYRVGDGKHWSTAHTFSTAVPNCKKFKFLVFGDSQSAPTGNPPYGLWRENVHNAYRKNPDARFMVNVGDLVDRGQNGAHWNGWFSATAGVIDTIPEMPVVGNHETTGSSDTRRPAYWDAQFFLPRNGPACLKNQAYSYDYGTVHIAVIDSQQSEQKQYGDIFSPQRKWLDADLSASKATWKIVFFHKGAYSIKDGRDNKSIRETFSPIIEKYHVDLVFNGHDHGIARTYPIRNGSYMKKPSQGTVYYIVGRSGSKFYKDISKKDWDAFFYNPKDQPNYLVVDVNNKQLTVRAVKMDGTLIDTLHIDKKKDAVY